MNELSHVQQGVHPHSLVPVQLRYSLAVVRLADPAHAQLLTMNATAGGASLPVCGPPLPGTPAGSQVPPPAAQQQQQQAAMDLAGQGLTVAEGYGPCEPNVVASLNVSAATAYLSLHPGLRYPDIQVRPCSTTAARLP